MDWIAGNSLYKSSPYHRPVASHQQTLSHIVVSSIPHHERRLLGGGNLSTHT